MSFIRNNYIFILPIALAFMFDVPTSGLDSSWQWLILVAFGLLVMPVGFIGRERVAFAFALMLAVLTTGSLWSFVQSFNQLYLYMLGTTLVIGLFLWIGYAMPAPGRGISQRAMNKLWVGLFSTPLVFSVICSQRLLNEADINPLEGQIILLLLMLQGAFTLLCAFLLGRRLTLRMQLSETNKSQRGSNDRRKMSDEERQEERITLSRNLYYEALCLVSLIASSGMQLPYLWMKIF